MPAEGRFCADCGAPTAPATGPPDHLIDFVLEWLARFRPDNIRWSTLGLLLVNPGQLSREWWEGRRVKRMSPVRMLFVVLLGGSLLSFVQRQLIPQTEFDSRLMIHVFTYQTALVAGIVTLVVLPRLLPKRLQRTSYQHATVALYEAAFLGVLAWAFYAAVVLLRGMSLPLPLMLGLALAHAAAHLKSAYGMSWAGAILRTGVLALCMFFAMSLVSVTLGVTGLQEHWTPKS